MSKKKVKLKEKRFSSLKGLKRRVQAIDSVERAIGNGFGHKQWIEHDSDLDALRTHPRFQALLQKLSTDKSAC
jgi:hypothetical protein